MNAEAMIKPGDLGEKSQLFGAFLSTLPLKAQEVYLSMTNVDEDTLIRRVNARGLKARLFPLPINRLFLWMDSFNPVLSQHASMSSIVTDLVIYELEGRGVGNMLTERQKLALRAGMVVHDLGKLSFPDDILHPSYKSLTTEEDELRLGHPAKGVYIFENFFPVGNRKDSDMKKMIESVILYHQFHYGRASDVVFEQLRLSDLVDHLPSLRDAKFRKLAFLSTLIDRTIAIMENRGGNGENPAGRVREALDDLLGKVINRFEKYDDFNEEEKHLYFAVKNILLRLRFNIGFALGTDI